MALFTFFKTVTQFYTVQGLQNILQGNKGKHPKDAMEFHNNINRGGQHESDGPYPHSNDHHEPPLPIIHHPQTSTLDSNSGSHEDGYSGHSNPPSGQSQETSSEPVPDGGAIVHRNNDQRFDNHPYGGYPGGKGNGNIEMMDRSDDRFRGYGGAGRGGHSEDPMSHQHGDWVRSSVTTDTESQIDSGTPLNSHLSSIHPRGHPYNNQTDITESHPAGTVMEAKSNRIYHKLPAPRSRHNVRENTTGTMEIKVGMHRAGRDQGVTQTTLTTTVEEDSSMANTTMIVKSGPFHGQDHGRDHEREALRTAEVDTESETDSSTETSGTELDVDTVNSMSSRPGGRRGDGGFVLLR